MKKQALFVFTLLVFGLWGSRQSQADEQSQSQAWSCINYAETCQIKIRSQAADLIEIEFLSHSLSSRCEYKTGSMITLKSEDVSQGSVWQRFKGYSSENDRKIGFTVESAELSKSTFHASMEIYFQGSSWSAWGADLTCQPIW